MPKVAFIADNIISRKIAKKLTRSKALAINPFLQDITRTSNDCLPPLLQQIIKTANKYKVSFAPLTVSKKAKEALLIWLYKSMKKDKRSQINSDTMICLCNTYDIMTVGDMKSFEELLATTANNYKHGKTVLAKYARNYVRCKGCSNPHKCSFSAWKHINKLEVK